MLSAALGLDDAHIKPVGKNLGDGLVGQRLEGVLVLFAHVHAQNHQREIRRRIVHADGNDGLGQLFTVARLEGGAFHGQGVGDNPHQHPILGRGALKRDAVGRRGLGDRVRRHGRGEHLLAEALKGFVGIVGQGDLPTLIPG